MKKTIFIGMMVLQWTLIYAMPVEDPTAIASSPSTLHVNVVKADLVSPTVFLFSADTNVLVSNDRLSSKTNSSFRNRQWTVLHTSADTQFHARYRKNVLHGEWKSWYVNGIRCDSGYFLSEAPDGEWKGWYPNGHLRYVLHFNARKLKDIKEELLRQPKTRLYFLSQKPVDQAVRHYDARILFGAESPNSGSVTLSGKINLRPYRLDDLRELVRESTTDLTGENYLPPFREGLLHGNFLSYHDNGHLKETGMYINGLREGLWENFEPDGRKAMGTYRHGKKQGEWRLYDTNGKLTHLRHYDSRGRITASFTFGS